jgi:hypothetical protein
MKDDWVMAMVVVVTMMNIERTWRDQVEEEEGTKNIGQYCGSPSMRATNI